MTSKQLAALASVDEAFEASGLDYWVFGGWAVDFYAGTVTCAHDDRAKIPKTRRRTAADFDVLSGL